MKKLLTFLTLFTLSIGVGWAATQTDVLNRAFTGVSGTNYSSWSGKTATSDAVYAGNSAGGNNSIQLRTNNNNSGIVTTTSGGKVTSVKILFNSSTTNGRTVNVYGKNSPYSVASDLYGDNSGTKLGSLTYSSSVGGYLSLDISGDYSYIGLRSDNGALYIEELKIVWETDGGTETVATPTFSPVGGTYYESQNVTISCSTEGATIRYTLDGTDPTASTGTVYNGSITVDETTTIKAIATKQGYNNSSVGTALYLISEPVANGKATFNAVNDRGTGSITKSPITFASTSGVLDNGSEYRLFKNSTTTFSVEDGYTITKIEFTCTKNGTEQYGPGCFAAQNGYSYEDNIGTWEGESQSVSFTASENQVRATLINVYFEESSAITVGAPSISFGDFTAGGTTVTATITDGSNATSTEYKIGEDGTYTATNGMVSIDLTSIASPITIYAKSINGEFESSEVHETFTLPALSVGVSPASYTGEDEQSVTISASNNVGTATLTYKINDGEVQTYSTPISLNAVGTYNITAYATDQRAGGEQVTATATITITDQPSGETLVATFVAGEDRGTSTSNTDSDEMSKGDPLVTVYGSKAAFNYDNDYRIYGPCELTISVPAGSKINKIVFNGNDTSRPISRLSTETGSYSVSDNVGTWTGESSSITFSASAQARCNTITVTYIPGETPDVVEYYLTGNFDSWNGKTSTYKFSPQQDGTYKLETVLPDIVDDHFDNGDLNNDYVRFKITKVVNDGNPVFYGGNGGNDDYGLHSGHHTGIETGTDDSHLKAFRLPDCFNAIFTLDPSTMKFDVDKPQLYMIGTFNGYATPTNSNVNGAKEMTPDTENGGWTLTDTFTDGAEFRLYDAWHVHHGGNGAWILEELLGTELNINNNNQSIFHIVGNGNYTITVNSDITKLVADRIPEKYKATIASGITGGTVSFNADSQVSTLNNLTEGYTVNVYVNPSSENYELTTLTYTIEGGSEAVNITQTEGVYSFSMPAGNVTINAAFNWIGGEVSETLYQLVVSNDDLEVGAKYIIVNEQYNRALVKAYTSQEIQINNHTTTISNDSGIPEFVLGNGTDEGTYTFKCGEKYLYNSSSTSLDITGTTDDNINWTINIGDAEDYFATLKSANNRIVYYFNSGGDFRAYSANNYTSNVKLYKEATATATVTLAQLVTKDVNKKYTIVETEEDVETGLLCVDAFVKDGIAKLVCKDNGHYAEKDVIADGQNDFLGGWDQFDQSNWIVLNVTLGDTDPKPTDFIGYTLTGITGTFTNSLNPEMTLDGVPTPDGEKNVYTPNTYIVPSFYGTQNGTGIYENETYFFVRPKPMEYANVKWAMWNDSEFVIPTGENANAHGLQHGSFVPDWSCLADGYSALGSTDDGQCFIMTGIVTVNASGSKESGDKNYTVMPRTIQNQDDTVITGVNDLQTADGATEVARFNVAGMRVDSNYRGVVIVVMSDGSAHKAVVK